jgi:HK97 family phage prohead protease
MMDKLAFDCDFKFADNGDAEGMVEGYASVFGILDRGGDIVMPGAFKGTLAEWKKAKASPPMLWQHDPYSPVGVWSEIGEDDKGLKVKGPLVMDVPLATSARALIKAGAVKGLSIGYETLDADIDRTTGARHIKKARLWEVSLVTFPMLPEAQISGVKTFDPRALESTLRQELKLSQADAVSAVALFKKHLREGDGSPGETTREGFNDLVMPLRKAIEALR